MVYEVVKRIPPGRVTTYGAIAQCLGTRKSSRMVGYALNKSFTQPEAIPAHRVVNRNGQLTGKHHFPTPDAMQQALEREGVEVRNDVVMDFKERFWDPTVEINIE